MGATAVFVQNSGEADLIIESMEFAHGHDFHVVGTWVDISHSCCL